GFGALPVLAGGGILYARRRAARRIQELRRHGTPVQTDFQNVEQNMRVKVNGRSPWRIVSQWKNPNTGELHLFESENLWFRPDCAPCRAADHCVSRPPQSQALLHGRELPAEAAE
ncbi:MAG: hypothetical protein ACJ8KO_04815, partial [Sulfurifustaceae bacterium]